MNQLLALKKFTKIVVDSGDLNEIIKYQPEDVTTNPSLILKIIDLPIYQNLVINAILYAKKIGGNTNTQIINATDKILVNIGKEILKYISGKISSEIDCRLSFHKDLCITRAKKIISMYEEEGIDRSKILIKLAATWECIRAAEELKKENINCNLTLLFSFAQARACAEAGVFLISPFVGRIYDWYSERNLLKSKNNMNDPGVLSVKRIYKYYKKHNYKTIIMGASFRNINQILSLVGCDYLTISPNLLNELNKYQGIIKKKLSLPTIFYEQPIPLNESDFRWEHNSDLMAVEKLSYGIYQFSQDQEKLEKILYSMM
ncbi:transaldolase [Buchnera aphidicola]|uniref:transaldolase n=1 Tax=Buchnera aphidicola TaxID=9 RepID=UPI003464A332